MVGHVPHAHLDGDAVRAYYLEQLPVSLVAEKPVKVDERVCGAQRHNLVFFVKGDTKDV